MKTLIKTFIAGSLLAATLATSAFAAEKTESLQVSGWHCGGCAAKTESALKDLKGVSMASADKKTQRVTVTYDDTKVKRADLAKAIAEAGFSVEK
jgi:P-type Cu+ transporter